MKQIRNKVFETNSSSTHSISIESLTSATEYDNKFDMNCDGTVSIKFGKFGWENREYTDAKTKFKYLCTMWFMLEGCVCVNIADLSKTEGYKLIEDGLISHLSIIKGLCIDEVDNKIFVKSYNDSKGKEIVYLDIDGHIDHQSVPSHFDRDLQKYISPTLKEWLDREDLTVEKFIFDRSVVLRTGNDNSD